MKYYLWAPLNRSVSNCSPPFSGLSNISDYSTVLNVMLAFVMKSIKLFVKHKKSSKEARSDKAEDYSYTTAGQYFLAMLILPLLKYWKDLSY